MEEEAQDLERHALKTLAYRLSKYLLHSRERQLVIDNRLTFQPGSIQDNKIEANEWEID